MSNRYEIEEGTNAVRVYLDGSDVANLFQPSYPDGTEWASAEEAESWAQLYIASVEDETAPFAPIGRGIPASPRLTQEEIEALIAQNQPQQNI